MTEETLFHEALSRPAGERAAYLDAACAGRPRLREAVEALLAAHEASGAFLEPVGVIHQETIEAPPGARAAPAREEEEEEPALAYLEPAGRPDSLGRIGHYEVLQVLGKGGFGVVFRAFDVTLHRVVAVKVLSPLMAATSPARKRFLREARTSAQVRHENVVQVYEVGEQPLPYLVMELIPGETLQQRIDRTGPLDVPEVLRIGRQIAEGLAAAHAQNLVHRDVKPANVLLEGGVMRVKLTDFGLARAADDASMSQSGTVAGTPMFMAPEQARGDSLDHRADLFSLGSLLYVMCTGRPPFRANNTLAVLKRVAEDTPRPIREIIPEVPQWLCDLITKLHAKAPDQRFQSAREVADTLAEMLEGVQAHGRSEPRRWRADTAANETPGRAPGRYRAPILVAGSLLLVAIAATLGVAYWPRGGGGGVQPDKKEIVENQVPPPGVPAAVSGVGFPGVPAKPLQGSPSCLPHVYSPDGKWLAAQDHAGTHATARVWNAVTGEPRFARGIHNAREMAFSPDGRRLVIPEGNGAEAHISVFDTATFEQVARWKCDPRIERAAFDRTGKVLAARDGNGVALYESETGKELGRIEGMNEPNGLAFSPAADLLAVEDVLVSESRGGRRVQDARVTLFDVDPKSPTYAKAVRSWNAPDTGDSHTLRFTPDGTRLAFTHAAEDSRLGLFVYDVKTGKQLARFVPGGQLTQIVLGPFLPDGRTVPLGYGAGPTTVALWDTSAGKVSRSLVVPDRGQHSTLVVDPSGKTLCTGGTASPQPLFFDIATGRELLPGPAPFFLLATDRLPERRQSSLAAAVKAARPGDVIEIRGDGPFESGPLDLGDKPLTLRAGPKSHPTIRFVDGGRGPEAVFVRANANLTLEGLNLESHDTSRGITLVSCEGHARLANCRLVVLRAGAGTTAIAANKADIINCLISSHFNISAALDREGFTNVANSTLLASSAAVRWANDGFGFTRIAPRTLRVTDSTAVAHQHACVFNLNNRESPIDDGLTKPLLSFEPSRSYFCISSPKDAGLLTINVMFRGLADADALDLMRRAIRWSETENLYHARAGFGALGSFDGSNWGPHRVPLPDLAKWHEFWMITDSKSREAAAVFQNGNRVQLGKFDPMTLSPDDFRLEKGSPGKGAGQGGKDLGADVDLVGPGAAYERWRQTPAYQKWRKRTGT